MGFAVTHNVDMIFASFIRKASDIDLIRKVLSAVIALVTSLTHTSTCRLLARPARASRSLPRSRIRREWMYAGACNL